MALERGEKKGSPKEKNKRRKEQKKHEKVNPVYDIADWELLF